jgi:hypothetical protein
VCSVCLSRGVVRGRGGFIEDGGCNSDSDSDSDSGTCNSPSSYRQLGGRGQLLSRRYCKHSGWSFLVRYSNGVLVPRRFGGFAQVLQTV